MRHKVLPRPFLSLTVFLLWAVITNSASLALLLLGALLAVAVPLLSTPFWPEPSRLVRPWQALRFLGTAKIGRMAVLPAMRGSNIGRAVLDALMAVARAQGEREVLLHAQISAAGFYQRAGFQTRGPQFDEAGIAHVEMVRVL